MSGLLLTRFLPFPKPDQVLPCGEAPLPLMIFGVTSMAIRSLFRAPEPALSSRMERMK